MMIKKIDSFSRGFCVGVLCSVFALMIAWILGQVTVCNWAVHLEKVTY